MKSVLSDIEEKRYTRQMGINDWGPDKQLRLKKSKVFIAGAGGLGSPIALYLTAAGVGHMRICDFDDVEISNLNRQILHATDRIGKNKAVSAQSTLQQLNPHVSIDIVTTKIAENNIAELLDGMDIVLDCLDNLDTRLVINRQAIEEKIPLVYGGIWGMEGRMTFIHTPETPCLNCLFSESFDTETFPAVGPTAGVIGALQAMEAIKYITRIGVPLKNKLLIWDGFGNRFNTVNLAKNPKCITCNGK